MFLPLILLVALTTTATQLLGNGFSSCGALADLFHIQSIDATPLPPQAGKHITFKTTGTLTRTVGIGSKISVKVSYDGFSQTFNFDLCKEGSIFGIKRCPIRPGRIMLNGGFTLPSFVPSGTVSLEIKAYDQNNAELVCLDGKFNVQGSSNALQSLINEFS